MGRAEEEKRSEERMRRLKREGEGGTQREGGEAEDDEKLARWRGRERRMARARNTDKI